ncbi:MAG: hypothetical protein OEM80_11120, partial [Desulfobulbaceae bacterium]|nr:hypothetical protein [Desulfobulbaceae bacterium]
KFYRIIKEQFYVNGALHPHKINLTFPGITQGGINFGQSRFAGPSGWLPFLVRFWANCQSSAVLYADKNEQRTKYIISYLE